VATGISQRAYARHRGVALRAVQKAIERGLPVLPGGKIDPDRADVWWAATADLSRPSNSVTGTGGRGAIDPGAGVRVLELPAHQLEFQKARTAVMVAKAHLLALEAKQRRGELVELAAVEAWLAERDTRIRDLLLGTTDRLGARLPAEHRRAVDDAIGRVCDELARAPGPPPPKPKRRR
jgi:phage terminase Nu1 subunit (DNA packaging protein)